MIVGAGPYGIALACELKRRGHPVTVVGRPFELWRKHTLDDMTLRSSWDASTIWTADGRFDAARFLAAQKRKNRQRRQGTPRIDEFRRYLDWIESQLDLDLLVDRVSRIERSDLGFRAQLESRRIVAATTTVLATGLGAVPALPLQAAAVGPARRLHSWQTSEYCRLREQRVLVVGGGQSAAEACLWLARHNRVAWAAGHAPRFRDAPLNVPSPAFHLLTKLPYAVAFLSPAWQRRLTRAVTRATVQTQLRRPLASIRRLPWNDTSVLEQQGEEIVYGSDERFDYVVFATGYRNTVAQLPFLSQQIRQALSQGPEPALGRDLQTRVAGLYVTGALAETVYGPALRFLLGIRVATQAIARSLARVTPVRAENRRT